MTNSKFKRWEIALCIGIAAALIFGVFSSAGGGLQERLIRLHVSAQSDGEQDQNLKLLVRDRALEFLKTPLSGVTETAEARAILLENIPALEEELQGFVTGLGFEQTVSASLTREPFPTREYATFSLPAGPYEALRITLGRGEGQNWWCVVFPPLCASAATELQPAQATGLTENDLALITQSGGDYAVRFKIAEWFGGIKNWFVRGG